MPGGPSAHRCVLPTVSALLGLAVPRCTVRPTQLGLLCGGPGVAGWLEREALPCSWQSCTPAGALGHPKQLRLLFLKEAP